MLGGGIGVVAYCFIHSPLSEVVHASASALSIGLIVGAIGGLRSNGRRLLVSILVAVIAHQILSLLTGGINSPALGLSFGLVSVAALGMAAAPPLCLILNEEQGVDCKTKLMGLDC
jgi:hypothetical protein